MIRSLIPMAALLLLLASCSMQPSARSEAGLASTGALEATAVASTGALEPTLEPTLGPTLEARSEPVPAR